MMLAALILAATVEVPVTRIVDDAKAIDRVAAAAKHDLPRDLLRRMLDEDIELMRGRRNDGGYDYASYERLEAGRSTDAFSIEATSDPEKLTKLEVKGSFVYRLVIESPARRMLVTKNRPLRIDHIEIEYIPVNGGASKRQNVDVKAPIDPGTQRNIDFDEIAKQATVRVYARADKENGYGNLNLSLVKARISDNPDSPYADAVGSAKAILRGLDHEDIGSMRSMAQRMITSLQPKVTAEAGAPPPRTLEVVAPRVDLELLTELQAIEDLLTGNENERRQGLDRLHQLVRKVRPTGR